MFIISKFFRDAVIGKIFAILGRASQKQHQRPEVEAREIIVEPGRTAGKGIGSDFCLK